VEIRSKLFFEQERYRIQPTLRSLKELPLWIDLQRTIGSYPGSRSFSLRRPGGNFYFTAGNFIISPKMKIARPAHAKCLCKMSVAPFERCIRARYFILISPKKPLAFFMHHRPLCKVARACHVCGGLSVSKTTNIVNT
jgi:hypothetical protein